MKKQNSLSSVKSSKRNLSKQNSLRKNSSKQIKGPWSQNEDKLLIDWVQKHGPKFWAKCAETIKGRNGKQCREHWNNSLNNDIIKGKWSTEEDLFIMVFYKKLDKSWKKMIPLFKSRTENAIKNRFYSQLRKITAKYVHKKVKEYNSKFNLNTLLKYHDEGIKEAKEDFLNVYHMENDEYNNFIKEVEDLINNKPPNQTYVDLDKIKKKYLIKAENTVIDNDKDNINEIDKDNKKEEKTENIEHDINKNENVNNNDNVINEVNKENEDNNSIDCPDDEDNNNNNDNKKESEIYLIINNDDDKKKENNNNKISGINKMNTNLNYINRLNETNKNENRNLFEKKFIYNNYPDNKTLNNIHELKININNEAGNYTTMNSFNNIIGQNSVNNYNNNIGCNNYIYNIYNNNYLNNCNNQSNIKENNNINYNNITNYTYNLLSPKIKNPNMLSFIRRPSDMGDYFRKNSIFTNNTTNTKNYYGDLTESPFQRYNPNSSIDNNNITTGFNFNNNYFNFNFQKPLNNNNDPYNISGNTYNIFRHSESNEIKNLNKLNYNNIYGFKKSTSFGSIKDEFNK